MKDLKAQIERSLDAKLKAYGREDKAEDRKMMQSHETSMHGVKHRAMGGAIEGGPARSRMDRGKGKKKGDKGKTTVNVVIAPKDDKPPMMPLPMVPPGGPGAGGPPPPMPPGPPMPPPGAGPGGPPMPPMPMRASGGRLGMTAGAGSGEGRLEKGDIQKRKD